MLLVLPPFTDKKSPHFLHWAFSVALLMENILISRIYSAFCPVLGKLGPRPGPVALRPGGYRASGRLDRAGYPAWPLYTLSAMAIEE